MGWLNPKPPKSDTPTPATRSGLTDDQLRGRAMHDGGVLDKGSKTDAVRAAAELGLPLGDGLSMAFDYEPEVWRLLRPWRWRSYHAAGPEYGDAAPGEVGFTPLPPGSETV
jgi:hypothetical protein